MRWGMVGTGLHAEQRLAPALAQSNTEVLRGVVGSSEAKARTFVQRIGAGRAYADLAALAADPEIDTVMITSPNDLHCRQTEIAAAAGKHVLVEKPMALAESDCNAMIEACRKAGVALGLGFQLRQHPVHREIHRLIRSGELGDVVMVRGEWHSAYGPWKNWRAAPARAGSDVIGAIAVHVLDLLCWFAGAEVRDVAALVDVALDTGQDQTIACSIAFANGAMGMASATRRSAWPLNSVQVWGTRGTAGGIGTVGMAPAGILRRTRGTDIEETELPPGNLYREQFESFARAAARGASPDATGEDGLRSTALVNRILARDR
ncbi:MAG: Gfo/Idh/MocA family oxidoreductase [Betaproteobacteria bacterium]|nr:Gfo/Idh/MocA family oxidoreductase [Betaproteobacteria bacterium]